MKSQSLVTKIIIFIKNIFNEIILKKLSFVTRGYATSLNKKNLQKYKSENFLNTNFICHHFQNPLVCQI